MTGWVLAVSALETAATVAPASTLLKLPSATQTLHRLHHKHTHKNCQKYVLALRVRSWHLLSIAASFDVQLEAGRSTMKRRRRSACLSKPPPLLLKQIHCSSFRKHLFPIDESTNSCCQGNRCAKVKMAGQNCAPRCLLRGRPFRRGGAVPRSCYE